MCIKPEQVQLIVDESEKRVMLEIQKLETRIMDDVVLRYNKAVALVHQTAPDTMRRIEPLEQYIKDHKDNNKWIVRWLVGSILTFLALGFSVTWWGATITSGIQHNSEQIQKISSDSLIKQDAEVLKEQLKSLQKEIENNSKK